MNNAVRLHVSLDLEKDTPDSVQITPGKSCERATLRAHLRPGDACVCDRYYGEQHAFFTLLRRSGCHCLIRLMDRGAEPAVLEELPVSGRERAAGIERQAMARLGSARTLGEVLRIIWVRGQNGQLLLPATDLGSAQLGAADAALLCRRRWQVEYFFRWLKCLMGCGHWIAQGPKGAAIQLCLALIGALLLELDLGRRPSRRVWELLQWHLGGAIDAQTLAQLPGKQLAAEEQRRASKKTR